jgi:hydrogenase/urease accessory protein HupE
MSVILPARLVSILFILFLVALVAPTPALAHMPIEGVGGFPGGLLHPILVIPHAMSLVALGLLIGGGRDRVAAALVFAAALVGGLIAIALAVGETVAGEVLLANTVLVGVLVAAAWAPPKPLAWGLAAVTGGAIALDSPPQATTIAEGNLMLLGTAMAACAALAVAVACSALASRHWQRLAVRVAGSWIAASAALVLAVALAR